MIKLISINPTGLFCFGRHKTIPLDKQGAVLLEGKNADRKGGSNGSGKSSFFHAIVHILFGKNPTGETADDVINRTLGRYFGRVVFTDQNGVSWRVTDVRKWRKTDQYPTEFFHETEDPSDIHKNGNRYSGTDVYLERWDGEMWKDERASNSKVGDSKLDSKSTRKKICDILHMDYEQFMSIAYMAQESSLKFVKGTHKDKLQVLSELSDLHLWDLRVARVKEDISARESEKSRLEAKLSGLLQIAPEKPADDAKDILLVELNNLISELAAIDEQIINIHIASKTWKTDIDKSNQVISDILNEVKIAQAERDAAQKNIDKHTHNFALVCDGIRRRPRPVVISKIETEISELNGQVIARQFDMEQLLAGAGKCPRCRTNVSASHLQRQNELLLVEISSLKDKIVAAKNILAQLIKDEDDKIKADIAQAEMLFQQKLAELRVILETTTVALQHKVSNFESAKQYQAALGSDPISELRIVEQKRLRVLALQSSKTSDISRLDTMMQRFVEHKAAIEETNTQINSMAFQIRHLKVVERMFGDKGIKAFKLNNILSMLNQLVDQYINIITDGNVKVFVTQYREKTDGSSVADIQILVREGQKTEVPLALYSGGERQQITLAFTGALWHLATACGSGINVMCLDETFGQVDESNLDDAFSFLGHMQSHGKESMFIVTHDTNIKQRMSFDQVWEVQKQNHTSTINTRN